MKRRYYLDVDFDPKATDSDAVGTALDHLIEAAVMEPPDPTMLDNLGSPKVGHLCSYHIVHRETLLQNLADEIGHHFSKAPNVLQVVFCQDQKMIWHCSSVSAALDYILNDTFLHDNGAVDISQADRLVLVIL